MNNTEKFKNELSAFMSKQREINNDIIAKTEQLITYMNNTVDLTKIYTKDIRCNYINMLNDNSIYSINSILKNYGVITSSALLEDYKVSQSDTEILLEQINNNCLNMIDKIGLGNIDTLALKTICNQLVAYKHKIKQNKTTIKLADVIYMYDFERQQFPNCLFNSHSIDYDLMNPIRLIDILNTYLNTGEIGVFEDTGNYTTHYEKDNYNAFIDKYQLQINDSSQITFNVNGIQGKVYKNGNIDIKTGKNTEKWYELLNSQFDN